MIWEVIQKYDSLPFSYDGADCCRFVGEYIEAVTGENPASDFLYSTEGEADSHIARYGSLYGLFRHVLGEPDAVVTEPAVALTECRGREMAGVIYKGRLVVKTERRVTDWPISRAKHVWGLKCRRQ